MSRCPDYPFRPLGGHRCPRTWRGRWFMVRLLVGALAIFSLAGAAEYHLTPQGDDAGSGSAVQPWKTLERANAALQPGDTVWLHPGEYEGELSPSRSGTAEAPIRYRAVQRERAVLTGKPPHDEDSAVIRLVNRQHIEIDGLAILPKGGRLMVMENASHCVIRNSRLENSTIAWESILLRGVQHCRFENLVAGRTMRIGGNWGHVTGNLWDVYASSHLVLEGIYFHRTGHHPLGIWHDCHDIVIRRCVFDGIWGRNFEMAAPTRVLIEQCVITQAFDGANSADTRAKLLVRDAIFRHNLVHHNYGGPLAASVWDVKGYFPKIVLRRSRMYHNTYVDNYEEAFGLGEPRGHTGLGKVVDNVFQNENFAFNGKGGVGAAIKVRTNVPDSNVVRASNIHSGRSGAATILFEPSQVPGTPTEHFALTPEEATRLGSVRFVGILDVDPRFVNREGEDYRLREDSPLIDAGRPLARTTHAGSGRIVPVDDAAWFFDGYGIAGELGDLIVIGDDQREARVVAVDAEFSTVTIDRDLTWEPGEVVTLPYTGTAPDIGAYEAGAEDETWYRAPRDWQGPRIPTMATATDVVVRTSFETEELEEWFMFWNFTRRVNSTAKLDDTTAGGGRRSVRVQATGEGASLGADIRPAEWIIDRFPTIRMKYRIPPGTPVGIWLTGYRSGQTVCIGGTRTRQAADEPDLGTYTLVDDDRWHEIELDARLIREVYPEVDVLWAFEFYTDRNAGADDRFWFDDFVILPAARLADPR